MQMNFISIAFLAYLIYPVKIKYEMSTASVSKTSMFYFEIKIPNSIHIMQKSYRYQNGRHGDDIDPQFLITSTGHNLLHLSMRWNTYTVE